MFKRLGFSSEEVCEIGKWKNVGAFTSHYLRLGASDKVGHTIMQLVHKVSPLSSADSDLTWTTGRNNPGGNVREDGAQSNGETRSLSPATVHCFGEGSVEGSRASCPVSLRDGGWWLLRRYLPEGCWANWKDKGGGGVTFPPTVGPCWGEFMGLMSGEVAEGTVRNFVGGLPPGVRTRL